MAKTKLGIYVIQGGDFPLVDYCAAVQPRLIVSCDHNPMNWAAVRKVSPNTFILGRLLDGFTEEFMDDPEGRADLYFEHLRPSVEAMRPYYDAWMSLNEPVVESVEAAHRLSRFHVRWGARMKTLGVRTAAYSFSQGAPLLELWPALAPGLQACDFLCLHEYDAPALSRTAGWRCLRYRQVWDHLPKDARRPILIGECGIDGGALDAEHAQQGWTFFGDEESYLNSLHWYSDALDRDDYVVGGAIFAMAGWGKKGSFSIIGANRIRAFLAAGGAPPAYVYRSFAEPSSPREPPPAPPPFDGWCPFAVRKPLASHNFWDGRGGNRVRAVVLHIAEGSAESAYGWFNNPDAQASSHFLVRKDGTIWQFVSVQDTAWANGLRWSGGQWYTPAGQPVDPPWTGLQVGVNPNLTTISIEHEGHNTEPWPPAMTIADRKLLAWLRTIPLWDRTASGWTRHVDLIAHGEIDPKNRPADPGPFTPWDLLVAPAEPPGQVLAPAPIPAPPAGDPGTPAVRPGRVPRLTVRPAAPRLASFPRPPGDTGWGVHGPTDPTEHNLEEAAAEMKRTHMTWTVAYGGDEAVCIRAAKFWKARGVLAVLRPQAGGGKESGGPRTPEWWGWMTRKARDAGLDDPLVQVLNEPEDPREQFTSPEHFASIWCPRADEVARAGGYPGLQALTERYFAAACKGMSERVRGRFFIVTHNYGANHDPAYPFSIGQTLAQDDTAVLRPLLHQAWCRQYTGSDEPIPTVGGEGGWQYESDGGDKSRGPVKIREWVAWHRALYDSFRTGKLPNGDPLPDWWLALGCWLILGGGSWYSDSWLYGLHSSPEFRNTRDDPGLYKSALLDALAATAPFERRFGYAEGPDGEAETLAEHLRGVARAAPWLPIFTGAALWKRSKVLALEDPQTDELETRYGGVTYTLQVFNRGILYAPKGEWDRIEQLEK